MRLRRFQRVSEPGYAAPEVVVHPTSAVPAVIYGPVAAVPAAVVDPPSAVPAVVTTPALEVANTAELIARCRALKAKAAQDFVDNARREAAQQVTERLQAERLEGNRREVERQQ